MSSMQSGFARSELLRASASLTSQSRPRSTASCAFDSFHQIDAPCRLLKPCIGNYVRRFAKTSTTQRNRTHPLNLGRCMIDEYGAQGCNMKRVRKFGENSESSILRGHQILEAALISCEEVTAGEGAASGCALLARILFTLREIGEGD